jgi:hypothetical protein
MARLGGRPTSSPVRTTGRSLSLAAAHVRSSEISRGQCRDGDRESTSQRVFVAPLQGRLTNKAQRPTHRAAQTPKAFGQQQTTRGDARLDGRRRLHPIRPRRSPGSDLHATLARPRHSPALNLSRLPSGALRRGIELRPGGWRPDCSADGWWRRR